MADRYDVAARLAEGEPAVAHIQTYVQACQSLGYQQPDLTAHASQVGDWYGTEVGLDLRVLDGDAAVGSQINWPVPELLATVWPIGHVLTQIARATISPLEQAIRLSAFTSVSALVEGCVL